MFICEVNDFDGCIIWDWMKLDLGLGPCGSFEN